MENISSITLKSIRKGMNQIAEIEKGKLKAIPIQELLNEL